MTEDEMIRRNEGLVYMLIRRLYNQRRILSWEMEDLVQEGFIGLLQAVRTYDEERGVTFSTYACKCIGYRLRATLGWMNAEKRREDRMHLSYEAKVFGENRQGETKFEDVLVSSVDVEGEALGMNMEDIEQLLKDRPKWLEAIRLYMAGNTQEEIGKQKKRTKQCVSQWLQSARHEIENEISQRNANE